MKSKVMYKKVNQEPEVIEVDFKSLKELQALVGGSLQTVPIGAKILLVCNEDGIIEGLEPNVVIGEEVILGDIFFCSFDDEDFVGLTDTQIGALKINFGLMDLRG